MAKKFLTGLNLVVLDVDPATGSEGELYFNSSASVAKIYQAGSWSVLGAGGGGGSTTVSTTEPSSPEIGDSWYKNDTGEFYIYDGTYWVEVNGVISLSQEEIQDYVAPLFTSASNTNVTAIYDDINNVINLNTSGSLISVDSIVYPDYITFDTTPEIEPADPGSLWWSTDFETLNLQLDAGVDLQIGQEHLVRVKNSSGLVAIPKGTAVMFAGAAGDTVEATPAVSTADSEPELLIGITAEIIPADGFGFVTQFGFINGTNTETPGWSLGNLLYIDPVNPGQLTNVKPSPPNWTFPIAAVTRINSNSGRILVRAIPGKHLHDIVDVLISGSVQNNEILAYDLSNGVWTNKTAEESGLSLSSHNHTLDSLSNVDINSLNDGDAIIWSSASSAWINQVASGGGGATTTVSETAPATPSVGDSWYKPSSGSFFIYDGSYWVEVTSIITMSDEEAQDKVAPLFDHANHINITASYDDVNNEIILTSSATPDLSAYLTASAAAATYATKAGNLLQFGATTSTELRNIIVDETGTGSLVFATSPTLAGTPLAPTATFETNTTQLATTAFVQSAVKTIPIIAAKTGTYVLALGDEGDLIQCNGTFNVNIPTDTVAFPIGTQITILNIGTGVITIGEDVPATTTLNGTPGLKLRAQWSSATLIKRAAQTWVVVGDLTA